jgi:hypothetical protein
MKFIYSGIINKEAVTDAQGKPIKLGPIQSNKKFDWVNTGFYKCKLGLVYRR